MCGITLGHRLLYGLGFQRFPFRLYALPGVRYRESLAELCVHLIQGGDLFFHFLLLRDHVGAARCIAVQKRECAATMREDLALYGAQGLQIAYAVELVTGLAHLRSGETQVEEANQRGRNGHREDEPSEFLPELQAVEGSVIMGDSSGGAGHQ